MEKSDEAPDNLGTHSEQEYEKNKKNTELNENSNLNNNTNDAGSDGEQKDGSATPNDDDQDVDHENEMAEPGQQNQMADPPHHITSIPSTPTSLHSRGSFHKSLHLSIYQPE